jgi:hypothetical protein
MPANEDLFQEWRTADREAHAMEQLVTRESLLALEGKGQAPTADDRAKAQGLRHTADDLFQLAMAVMDAKARANRHS